MNSDEDWQMVADDFTEEKRDAFKRMRDASSPDTMYSPSRYPQKENWAQEQGWRSQLQGTILTENNEYHLLSKVWFEKWINHIDNHDSIDFVGKIDNSSLCVAGKLKLKNYLSTNVDFYPVENILWEKLVARYGILDEKHDFVRKAIFNDDFQLIIELYLKRVHVLVPESSKKLSVLISITANVQELIESISKRLGIPSVGHKLYMMVGENKLLLERDFSVKNLYQHVKDDEELEVIFEECDQLLVNPADIRAKRLLKLEQKKLERSLSDDLDSKSPLLIEAPTSSSSSLYDTGYRLSNFTVRQSTKTIGTTGLNNLGNTCFMNSALQCLSNAIPLTSYFLGDTWSQELNPDNPMGMQGKIAKEYAQLIYKLWDVSPNRDNSIAPRDFKYTIGEFNSTFSGYFQQDSQELLGFLLDGLHEDLNRIKKKPYSEIPDMKGQPDKVIADKIWELYKLRNDSVIVDYFQGEYRSRVECQKCGTMAVTFDPYMFLTLPIPQNQDVSISLNIMPLSDSLEPTNESLKPFKVGLRLPKESTIKDLKDKIMQEVENDNITCVVVEYYNSKIEKTLEDYEPVTSIGSNDDIYLVLLNGGKGDKELVHLPIYFSVGEYAPNSYSTNLVGTPQFLTVCKTMLNVTSIEEFEVLKEFMYRGILKLIRRYSAVPLFTKIQQEEVVEDSLNTDMDVDASDDQWIPVRDDLFVLKKFTKEKEPTVKRYGVTPKFEVQDLFQPMPEISASTVTSAAAYTTSSPQADIQGMSITSPKEDIEEDPVNPFIGPQLPSVAQGEPVVPEPVTKTPVDSMEDYYRNLFDFSGNSEIVVEIQEDIIKKMLGMEPASFFSKYSLKNYFEPLTLADYEAWAKKDKIQRAAESNKTLSFDDCLAEFTKEEVLGENDTFYCGSCKKHERIKKKIDIWSVPEILVFSLKRFSNGGRSSFRSLGGGKIDCLIEFPLEGLDLTDFIVGEGVDRSSKRKNGASSTSSVDGNLETGDFVYDLFGVSNHIGGTGGGHYTAYAKNPLDNEWYLFDDSRVSKANVSDIVSREAYLLFYHKRKERDESTLAEIIEKRKQTPITEPEPVITLPSSSPSLLYNPEKYTSGLDAYAYNPALPTPNFYAPSTTPTPPSPSSLKANLSDDDIDMLAPATPDDSLPPAYSELCGEEEFEKVDFGSIMLSQDSVNRSIGFEFIKGSDLADNEDAGDDSRG